MICNNCGNNFPDNVRFCPNCGTPASGGSGYQQNYQQNYQQQNYQQQNYQQQNYQQQNYQQAGMGYGFKVPIKRKDIVVCIILSIVTCGIYGIIWFIQMVDELNLASGQQDTPGVTVFLLSIVTCSIYLIYWMYKAGDKVNIVRQNQGLPPNDSAGILYLLLTLFGFGIIAYCLIQSELNNVASF